MRDLLEELDREGVPRRGPRSEVASRPGLRAPAREEGTLDRPIIRERLGAPTGGPRPRARAGVARWGRHRLAADSVRALRAIGAFGTVGHTDLKALYTSPGRATRSIRRLESAGLLQVERFRRGRLSFRGVTLTAKGVRLLVRSIDPRDAGDRHAQTYLRGPARPSQVLHDLAVYRAARQETGRIEASGRSVRRVVTERELQARASRVMHAARTAGADGPQSRAAAAKKVGLKVVDGKLAFPDVRLETVPRDNGEGRPGSVDIELVTRNYRQASLRAKGTAGFTVYRVDDRGTVIRAAGRGG